jgi:hypothetical protein
MLVFGTIISLRAAVNRHPTSIIINEIMPTTSRIQFAAIGWKEISLRSKDHIFLVEMVDYLLAEIASVLSVFEFGHVISAVVHKCAATAFIFIESCAVTVYGDEHHGHAGSFSRIQSGKINDVFVMGTKSRSIIAIFLLFPGNMYSTQR